MLVRFHVSNYLSFDKEVELSMVPGKTRTQHPEHVVKSVGRENIDVLKAAIIYGANASGKSNLIKAMAFARELIVEGTHGKEVIRRKRFKLRQNTEKAVSKFEFEFKAGSSCYVYGFKLDRKCIHEEWLYEIRKTTEVMLFERVTDLSGETTVKFEKNQKMSKKERDFFEFVAMGTRPNQLFLRESIERDIKRFDNIFNWFSEKLVIIFPESKFLGLPIFCKNQDLGNALINYLGQLGTGISGIELEVADSEKELPKELLEDISRVFPLNVKDNKAVFLNNPQGERLLIEIVDEELKVKKLVFQHQMSDSKNTVLFGMEEESDGTRRLLDLLPGLVNSDGRVFVIDELDRSLHSKLSYKLVELFLKGSNSQFISTTHEAHLLDLNLLRRDEIWFVEKDQGGASHVYSLEEYAPRPDMDIEKGYLLGRYGAIPVFGNMAFDLAGGE